MSIVGTYGLAGVLLSYIPAPREALQCQRESTIFVATNGVHLYLILPKESVSDSIKLRLKSASSANYISFGWGDKIFYTTTPTWSDLSLKTAIKALFTESPTAMHVSLVVNRQPHWKAIEICKSQLKLLNRFVLNSFETKTNNFIPVSGVEGYSSNDYFYEGTGNYTLFYTSNVWVNKALKEAQIKTSLWSPFDFGVLYHID